VTGLAVRAVGADENRSSTCSPAGRRTTRSTPTAWLEADDAARTVAIYFSLPADHGGGKRGDADAGADESPFQRWRRYPIRWRLTATLSDATLEQSIVDLGIGRDGDSATIYESRVVPRVGSPRVRERVTRPDRLNRERYRFRYRIPIPLGTEPYEWRTGSGDDERREKAVERHRTTRRTSWSALTLDQRVRRRVGGPSRRL